MTKRPRAKVGDPLAAGLEVLRRELHALKKRCARCEERRPIGFRVDTDCVGGRVLQGKPDDG